MLKEFKAFIMRGNVVDLAVGVIIGAAFGAIVKSLVDDIIMPPLGVVLGTVDFSNLFIPLDAKAHAATTFKELKDSGGSAIRYGLFVNNVINFAIGGNCHFLRRKGSP